MEEEKVPSKPADARIVRTVRKLKSNVSHANNKLEENKSKDNKIDAKSLSRGTTGYNSNLKLVSNKSINNKINDNNKQKIPNKNSNNKILLDGSVKTNDKKVFDYETLKKYKKNTILYFKKIYFQMIILINIKRNL